MAGPYAAQIQSALQNFAPAGSSIVHQATVTLTDTQIKTLPNDPVEIIPAPGENKIVVLVSAVGVFDTLGGTLTNVENLSLFLLVYTPSWNEVSVGGVVPNEAIKQYSGLTPIVYPPTFTAAPTGASLDANSALSVVAYNGEAGNYTGGDSANSLTINIAYLILNLTTGEFE